ncbi:arsenic transporter [Arthrobacter sp. KBS0703]|jgi:Na+/H+ antiporter NhaD/arsenite permease-like protein|uniref:SLC13 family permease n=2 Tax=Bacteria TaxID=2 RepID=UPI00098FD460|nr:SLC13 family permease [Arthrobacter sp. KBS0703]TSE17837.1 arsenic transporter [Arthrobacter sp. KBS0703]
MLAAGAGALAAGFLPWDSFQQMAGRTVPVLAFVLAMTVVTELVDDAGLFRVVTDRIAALGRGSVFLLWLLVLALSAVATAFLSLDTTAVLVTPVVVLLAVHARIPPLPFALSTVWLANTASLLLPVSNLTNLLAQGRLSLTPLGFAGLMWAPSLVGVLVPALLLWLAFRKDLRGRYGPQPAHWVRDRTLLRAAGGTLLVLLPALVSGVPVAIPALAAAAFLLVLFLWRRPSALRWSMLPWRPLMLTAGLFMVVEALHSHGLTQALAPAAGSGEAFPELLRLAALGAGSANVANNLPAYLALEPVAGSPLRLAALLIGVNLGPLVSPWASLATLLWHERLQTLNLRVRWGGFALAGVVVVLLALPLAVLALWLCNGMP